MQMTPTVQMSALQNTADRGGTELGSLGDAIGGIKQASQGDHFFRQRGRSSAGAAQGTRRTIKQTGRPLPAKTMHPFSDGLGSDLEVGRGQLQGHSAGHML